MHILSSVLLVGTGFGSAFYMFFANRTRNLAAQAVVARYVVLADWLFTTPTIFIQPATGLLLVYWAGWSLSAPWLMWSIALYVLAGACWLPVVWLQIQMKRMAERGFRAETSLAEAAARLDAARAALTKKAGDGQRLLRNVWFPDVRGNGARCRLVLCACLPPRVPRRLRSGVAIPLSGELRVRTSGLGPPDQGQ